MKIIVGYSDILKRYEYTNETVKNPSTRKTIENCKMYYKQAKKTNNRLDVLRFIKECSEDNVTVKEYFSEMLSLVEQFTDDNEINNTFIEQIVSKLPNENKVSARGYHFTDRIKESSIPKEWKEKAKEKIIKTKVADRVLENHNRLQSEFDLVSFFHENSHESQELLTTKICEVVNRFDIKPYGKLNTALEEGSFLFQRSDMTYQESSMVDSMIGYFLLQENITENDIDDFYKVVKENHCIGMEWIKRKDVKEPKKTISEFMNDPYKDHIDLHKLTDHITEAEVKQVISGFPMLLETYHRAIITKHSLTPIIRDSVIDGIMESFQKNEDSIYYKDLLEGAYETLGNEIGFVERCMGKFDKEVTENLYKYRGRLIDLNESVLNEMDFVYGIDNLSVALEQAYKEIPLNEFKIVIALAVSKAVKKAGRLISGALQRLQQKTKGRIRAIRTKGKIVEKPVDESVYEMIDSDHCVDCCVAVIEMDTSPGLQDCHKALEDLCHEITVNLKYDEVPMKAYYTIYTERAEIRLKNEYKVSLTEAEETEFVDYVSDVDAGNIEDCMNRKDVIYDIDPEEDIFQEACRVFRENPDVELFDLFIEACEVMGIEKEYVESIYEQIEYYNEENKEFCYPAMIRINHYDPLEEVGFDVCMEAYSIMQRVFADAREGKYMNEASKKDNKGAGANAKVKELEEKEAEKTEEGTEKKSIGDKAKDGIETAKKAGVSAITNVKLYMHGLKKKVRDLGAKQKELVNRADATMNRLARSCKDALVSDKRESIIKGSVIPSFSKSCKIAVALAGIAKIASPAAALVTAMGGLVASKHLTRKERALMLDEIDVELEMIEKEIQLAESKNQMKKLRKLMMIRKDLQREYQAIKLGMKLGTNKLAIASGGRKEYN